MFKYKQYKRFLGENIPSFNYRMWVLIFFSPVGMPFADLESTAGRSNILASSPGCLHRHCICQPMLYMLKKPEISRLSTWKSLRHPLLRSDSSAKGRHYYTGCTSAQHRLSSFVIFHQSSIILYWWILAIFPIILPSEYSMAPNWSIPLTCSSTLHPTCIQKGNQTKCK